MLSKKDRIDKEARFWVLMAQGSTLIAACEAVGVDRRLSEPEKPPVATTA
jgi:IS30 family transposase